MSPLLPTQLSPSDFQTKKRLLTHHHHSLIEGSSSENIENMITMAAPSVPPSKPGKSNSGSVDKGKQGAAVKAEKRTRESDTGEYDEWAKRLVSRPIPQLQPTGPRLATGQLFQSGNNTFIIQSVPGSGATGSNPCVGGDGLPPHNG